MVDETKYELTGEYSKLIISANTIVPKGAVKEKAIYKSVDGKISSKITSIIAKSDDEKMALHSIMYMLNSKDSHGNFVTKAEVLEDACTNFMLNGSKIVKYTHDGKEIDASVQQLYIVEKNHPVWSDDKYIGAIANVIKFNDVELYKYCKNNDWETSIEGEVEEVSVPIEKTNMFKQLYDKIIKEVKEVLKMKEPENNTNEVVSENKVDGVATDDVKKEIDPMIAEYVATIVNELVVKYDAKYDELKSMIESIKPSDESEEIVEMKKEMKELKKEIGRSSQIDSVQTVKKSKTLLS
jgi:hypothetical protein